MELFDWKTGGVLIWDIQAGIWYDFNRLFWNKEGYEMMAMSFLLLLLWVGEFSVAIMKYV